MLCVSDTEMSGSLRLYFGNRPVVFFHAFRQGNLHCQDVVHGLTSSPAQNQVILLWGYPKVDTVVC